MRKPTWVQKIQSHRKWFDMATKLLDIAYQTREGGIISRGLGIFASIGDVTDTLWPKESSYEALGNIGLTKSLDLALGGLYCEILLSDLSPEVITQTGFSQTLVWYNDDRTPLAGAIYYSGQFGDGPFITEDGFEKFASKIRDILWKKSDSLVVSTTRNADSTYKGSSRYRFDPMQPLGKYFRKREPQWYIDRFKRYPPGPLTILLRGPTGMGKSVLARHIALGMRPLSARTLKISSKVLEDCSSNEIFCMTQMLQPTVLLLDDLDLSSRTNTETFLDILEILRDPNCIVIITMMTPPEHVETEPKDGSWHFSGMRPGRIDDVYTLYPLDDEERETIIREYLTYIPSDEKLTSIVKATEGLSGAYIKRVCDKLNTLGWDDWEHEVKVIRYMAPFVESIDDNEDDDDDCIDESPPKPKTTKRDKNKPSKTKGICDK